MGWRDGKKFPQRRQMAKKAYKEKKELFSLIIREMKIKTMRYTPEDWHLSISTKPTNVGDAGDKGTLTTAGGNVDWSAFWKTMLTFLRKLGIGLPYDSAILLLGICPTDPKTLQKRYLHSCVHCSIFHSSQNPYNNWCENIWLGKETVVHRHNGNRTYTQWISVHIVLTCKKRWYSAVCCYVDGSGVYTEWN